jgi:ketosteroid isomerase-like protein
MSQEGVDKLRRGYEVLNREGVDAALNLGFIDPDIVVRESQDMPDTDIYRGHDGMRRLLGMFFETFDDLRLEPEEFRDLGDRYLVRVRTVGRGKGSSVPIDQVIWHLWWEGSPGVATALQVFNDRDRALEAVSLSE